MTAPVDWSALTGPERDQAVRYADPLTAVCPKCGRAPGRPCYALEFTGEYPPDLPHPHAVRLHLAAGGPVEPSYRLRGSY